MYELVLLALRRVKRQKQPKHPNLSGNESKECLCVHIKKRKCHHIPGQAIQTGPGKDAVLRRLQEDVQHSMHTICFVWYTV